MTEQLSRALTNPLRNLAAAAQTAELIVPIIFFVAMVALMGWKRPADRATALRLWPLAGVVLAWLFISVWAGWFWRAGPRNPDWVLDVRGYALLVAAVSVVGAVAFAREARVFAGAAGALGLYLCLVAWFVGAMEMSGTWL